MQPGHGCGEVARRLGRLGRSILLPCLRAGPSNEALQLGLDVAALFQPFGAAVIGVDALELAAKARMPQARVGDGAVPALASDKLKTGISRTLGGHVAVR